MTEYKGGYTSFGSSGLRISRIAFGCGFRGTPDPKDCEKIILQAIDTGINFIDCANIYLAGDGVRSEIVLGKALAQVNREELVITTKVGASRAEWNPDPNGSNSSRYHILREVEESLKRLKTDHIDVYLFHLPDDTTPFEEQLRAMEQLCRDGKVRYVGLCNYKAWQVTEALGIQKELHAQPLIGVQNPYNLLNRALEDEMFPMLRTMGIGLMSYNPLAAGLLGGQYLTGKPVPERAFWNRSPMYREYLPYVFRDRYEKVIMAVHDMAEKYHCNMSHIASAWILSHGEVSALIAGANTFEEFEDMLKTFELELDPEDLQYLTDLSEDLRLQLTIMDVPKSMARIRRLEERVVAKGEVPA